MHRTEKPVRQCYSCRLNLSDHCWLYRYPRGQWRRGRRCRAFENEDAYREFDAGMKEPTVKTRKELRRSFFRSRTRTELHHDPVGHRRKSGGDG